MTSIIMLWVFLGAAVYWQIQRLDEKRIATNRAAYARHPNNKFIPPSQIPKINPGAWPPPAGKTVEMAQDLTAANYLIVFDGSFSMNESRCSGSLTKLQVAKSAVKKFISALGPGANVGLVGFGGSPSGKNRNYEHPLVSGDRTGINNLLDGVRGLGNTPLSRSVFRGFEMLEAQARRQGGYGQYHMVIVTDGISTDGDPSIMTRNIVERSAIKIHTIGFCINDRHGLNVPGYTRYSTASDPGALEAGLRGVLSENDSFDPGVYIKQ
ncbi:MAG: VWA domain-containing protein [Nitrospinota bacterium]|nr:VWA domain-containing protein [Nitrospinota bacterium]